ncbi:dachshund homolog 2 [Lingula anatina]|uniref:Dachshund homolog 2 n=1 Tax=Lingula anatina TaxID=7574 RepID=A0A1S3J651_LINAN|nr:dachshund homolog 2 [Lingula anatina]|eukprot:XP_013405870.1 dachshund homolog 2 [Lingula anatina]
MMESASEVVQPLPARASPPAQVTPGLPPTSNTLLYKLERPTGPLYSSPRTPPPTASNKPENNICKMIEYRGAKVAAFNVDGRELICLPQAFDLFLKHLVGGLHTVYTKLKRLEITPVVCNVEQVRILRGLGAIQPGVNRCKLIAPKEFDVLYEDCTNSSARPGRPPKRSSILSPSPTDTLQKLKKSRLDSGDYGIYREHPFADPEKKSPLLSNGYNHYPHHLAMLPFMHLQHPMAYPAVSMAMANHFPFRPADSLTPREALTSPLCSPKTKDDRYEARSPQGEPQIDSPGKPDRHYAYQAKEDLCRPTDLTMNGHSQTLDLSKHGSSGMNRDIRSDDEDLEYSEEENSEENSNDPKSPSSQLADPANNYTDQTMSSKLLTNDSSGISSIESLLVNIQGLLKVAVENAKHRERQINLEKGNYVTSDQQARQKTKKLFARPGRPPKRSSILSPSPTDTLQKLKKSRLDSGDYGIYREHPFADPEKKSPLLSNGYNHYPHHLAMLPFMHLQHPMAYPAVSMAMANHFPFRPADSLTPREALTSPLCSPKTKDDRYEARSPQGEPQMDSPGKPDRHYAYQAKEDLCRPTDLTMNGHSQTLDLSKHGSSGMNREIRSDDEDLEYSEEENSEENSNDPKSPSSQLADPANNYTDQTVSSKLLTNDSSGISSIESLLVNIQGLLKVAVENAKHRERQINLEKADLKMEVMRERELRETLEKQLHDEQRSRVMLQKKLKREKKVRRRLQDQVEGESKQPNLSLDRPSPKTSPQHEQQDKLQTYTEPPVAEQESETERTSNNSTPDHDDRTQQIQDAQSRLQALRESYLPHSSSLAMSSYASMAIGMAAPTTPV